MKQSTPSTRLNEEVLQKGGLPHLKFLDAIAELPYVDAIYLFGSRARGDYRERSDIDLAVRYSDDNVIHRRVVRAIISEVADTFLSVDVVDYDDMGKNLKEMVDKEKVALYERA